MTRNEKIMVFPNTKGLFQFAAKDFCQRATTAINAKGFFSVVLSGGNTPKSFYHSLAQSKEKIPWMQIKFFFGDERYVPSHDANNNYHIAYEHLFSKVPINPENIYRIPTEFNDPKDAAKNYEQTLRKAFHITNKACPEFDLVYLGLGDNAHTASLMPASDIVRYYTKHPFPKNAQLVASLFVSDINMYRITLTPKAINNGMNIIF